ncbi:ROK family protein [Paenibacillus sp. DMB20]|uniref:ROK family protein n=1 Tax=Paenibacillus sp. DMB20 TaxID=1642570 RepID=UPI0006281829|nr:ROK family protein [Paenibacillus sp. DMB20]KKO54884.1 transcriptional regulator [Paenibacillus sp. DMB20]
MRSGDGPDFGAGAPAEITLALDAGGTVLKGALLVNGQVVPGSFMSRPSESQGPASGTIAGFAGACLRLLRFYTFAYGPLHRNDEVRIGFAFPGPFDYEEGIALLQGVGKYEALYKMSVRDLLRAELHQHSTNTPGIITDLLASADIRFGNDALMFGLGIGLRFPSERLICLTLGTGLGSAFVENGQLVSATDGVPLNGMLFAEPYRDSIVDDYFGRRGILGMASQRGILAENTDVADLAEAAKLGDAEALELFHEYGRRLGEMLLPYVIAFKPDRIVLGGQISNSFALWENDMQQSLGTFSLPVLQLQDGIADVFKGIHKLFEDTDGHPSASLHK